MNDALMKSRLRVIGRPIPAEPSPLKVLVRQPDGSMTLGRPTQQLATPRDYSIDSLRAAGIPLTDMHAPFGSNPLKTDFDRVARELDGEIMVGTSHYQTQSQVEPQPQTT